MNELLPGAAAPWFHAPALGGNRRDASNTAGQPCLCCYWASVGNELTRMALATLREHRSAFANVSGTRARVVEASG